MSNLQQDLNPRGAYTELAALLRCRFSAQDLKLFAHQPARSILSGGERTRCRGRGMDFEEVRLYQPGDDIRSIDWRVTARTQVAHTKIFREERERPVFMLVDQRSPLFFGSTRCFKSVLAAHIAALLGWAALANGDRLGALVFGDYDVDGTTAVACMYQFLKKHYEEVDFYIPHRYKEGYGVSKAGIEHAQQNGHTLIISLDCGIKSVELVAFAKEQGIDFIVCDHHLPDESLPDAVAMLRTPLQRPQDEHVERALEELVLRRIGRLCHHASGDT